MSHRAAWFTWSVWTLTVMFSALSLLMPNQQNGLNILLPLGAWASTSSTVGAIIVSQRPKNPVGWILCAMGFLFASNGFLGLYAFRALVSRPGSLPAGEVAAWFSTWMLYPALGLFPFLFFVFPDGQPLSPRWRPLLWINGILVAAGTVAGALTPGPIEGLEPVRNPLGIEGSGEVLGFVVEVFFDLVGALVLISAVVVYLRLRRAGEEQRQQIKWLVYAAAVLGIILVVSVVGDVLLGGFGWWFFLVMMAAFLGLPLSIGTAMLRYRLYEIDILINRTLVYGSLTATLVVAYFGGIVMLQRVFVVLTGEKSTLAVVASTLVIAALFNPLRSRVQAFVDRRFYRRKYDARKTLEAFSTRLRDETDLGRLGDEMVGVVRETIQPTHVGLWLRPDKPSKKDDVPG